MFLAGAREANEAADWLNDRTQLISDEIEESWPENF